MLAIVIPFYKLTFFKATLMALANQTDTRFKVYIGDDASPENPETLLNSYKNKIDFKYTRFDENFGSTSLVKQWERCLNLVENEEWIMILGDDDKISEDVVASFYKHHEEFNTKSNLVRFASKVINEEEGDITESIFKHPTWESAYQSYCRKVRGLTRSSLSEYVFLKSIYAQKKFTEYPLAFFSDDKAWLDFSNDKPIYSINDALVMVRISEISISGRVDNLDLKIDAEIAFLEALYHDKLHKFDKGCRLDIIRKYEVSILKKSKLSVSQWLSLYLTHLKYFEKKIFFKFNKRLLKSIIYKKKVLYFFLNHFVLKKSLIVTAPFLNSIGGTEIEAVTTAISFYDSNSYDKVTVFSAGELDKSLFENLIENRSIDFLTYPTFFSKRVIKLFDRLFKKNGFQYNISEYLFWKLKGSLYNAFFMLAYPKSVYFFPIAKAVNAKKKCVAKITMWHFFKIPEKDVKFYKYLKNIIVFNNIQKSFWNSENKLNNVIVQDIIIPNEENLLGLHEPKFYEEKPLKFGYLGRISEEKNIEDIIKLLDYLINKKNKSCTLMIQGIGNKNYVEAIKKMASEFDVIKHIDFRDTHTCPSKSHLFYKQIDVFLVTSKHEGGPITALEAAAAGRMLLSYNVGAMADRFSLFPYIVNGSFNELCNAALSFCNLSQNEKLSLLLNIRNHYKDSLSNSKKGAKLMKIFKHE